MGNAFLGSHAVRGGQLTPYQLRTQFRSIHRDVYLTKHATPTLLTRTVAAWLWSRRRATVAGLAAAALHGSHWISDQEPVELIWRNPHAPVNVVTRNERIDDDEIVKVTGLPVTSPARTAFDLGRRGPLDKAVARLDALARATGIAPRNVEPLIDRYGGARGVRQLRTALKLMDAGAQSPKETWLRLQLIDAGLPKPTTQLMVHNGDYYPLAYLDMGWDEPMVAVEYDGDQHRTDRRQYVKDMSRLKMLEGRGWIVIRVIAEDRPEDIIDRVRKALNRPKSRDT
jgi:hypothetical protein